MLIIAGFFQEEQVGMELADQVVDMAYQALKTIPSKENLLYLSVAYARKGDYKKAFELMAGEPFLHCINTWIYPYSTGII